MRADGWHELARFSMGRRRAEGGRPGAVTPAADAGKLAPGPLSKVELPARDEPPNRDDGRDDGHGRRERKRALDGDEAAGPLEVRRVLGDEPAGSPLEAHRELDADVRHKPSPKARRWLRDEAPHEEALHEDALDEDAPHEHALHEHALHEDALGRLDGHVLARLTCSPEDALGPRLDEHALGRLDGHALHEHALHDDALGRAGKHALVDDALGRLDAQRVLGDEACGPLW